MGHFHKEDRRKKHFGLRDSETATQSVFIVAHQSRSRAARSRHIIHYVTSYYARLLHSNEKCTYVLLPLRNIRGSVKAQ